MSKSLDGVSYKGKKPHMQEFGRLLMEYVDRFDPRKTFSSREEREESTRLRDYAWEQFYKNVNVLIKTHGVKPPDTGRL